MTNIGFGPGGTNALDPEHPLAKLGYGSLHGRTQPKFMLPRMDADEEFSIRCAYAPQESYFLRAARVVFNRAKKFLLRY